jgi:DNA-directed RNA polymerase specialized sigma24 family protein
MEQIRRNARATEVSGSVKPATAPVDADEAAMVEQIRCGDAEAGQRFIRDYYPDVYHYLLYLTGSRDAVEDLAQETFVRAWRGISAFEGRAPLRLWLHRIARREFLGDQLHSPLSARGRHGAEPAAPGRAGTARRPDATALA